MLKFKEDIQPYLIEHGKDRPTETGLMHKYYEQSVKHAKLIESVFGDEYPEFLQVDRPREKEKKSHRKFRQDIYKAVTKPFLGRVHRSLSAIRNADDLSIQFKDTNIETKDGLQFYTEKMFGAWGSLEQWFWEQGVSRYIEDPNSCAVILPQLPMDGDQTKFPTVKALWASSANVWYYAQGEKAVIKSERLNRLVIDGRPEKGKTGITLYFFDNDSYCEAKQVAVRGNKVSWEISGVEFDVDANGKDVAIEDFPLHFGKQMPVYKLGSFMDKTSEDGTFVLYKSIIADAVPALKSVLQRASDIDIEALLHTGSLEWQYVTKQCKSCNGTGKITDKTQTAKGRTNTTTRRCETCMGSGHDIFDSNLEKILISPPTQSGFDDDKPVNLPTPPAGMIERSPDAIEQFREEYKRNMLEAYQSVGLGHRVSQMFMATSGTSKRYDRDEEEKLLVSTARHFVENILIPIYSAIAAARYGQNGDYEEFVPYIKAPKRFDITTLEITREELNDAMQNGYGDELKDALQLKYLEQTAGKESLRYRIFRLKMRLDPLRNMNPEMKTLLESQATMTMDRTSDGFLQTVKEIQFSRNFDICLRNASMSDDEFFNKELKDQYEILLKENEKYFSIRPANQPIEMTQLAPLIDVKDLTQLS